MAHKPWEHAKSSGSEADPLATRFVESLSVDTRLYAADIEGSLAHARMLKHVDLITERDLSQIECGLNEIKAEIESAPGGVAGWAGWKIELEDVHMCIEAALTERIGEPARKLHTGRSRNDQVALDLRLWCRDGAQQLIDAIDTVQTAFEDLAAEQGDVLIPTYTHLQRAQPACVGAESLAWHAMLDSCKGLAQHVRDVACAQSPLGSGAIAGTSLPIDRQHTAAALGFTSPTPSSIASTASRDEILDLMYAMTRTMTALSRWAEQWIIYASTEFSFITLADAYTTGSSMMPQKRNPDMLELIRGKSALVLGQLTGMLAMCKGLTIGYNRDLQDDKRLLFPAFDATMDSLAIAAGIVRTTRFNKDRIEASLDQGYLDATSLADYLVTVNVPFRTAHQIVGSLVKLADTTGRHRLTDLTLDEISQAATNAHPTAAVTDTVYSWLGPANVVARYTSAGNAGSDYKARLAQLQASRRS